jgi:glucose-1-phosphate cytidylyltransferase
MKVAILAGGRGTRLGNRPEAPPKPLVEIGGRPILWHVLMQFRHQGFDDFIIALGHRGAEIEAYVRHLAERERGLALRAAGPGEGDEDQALHGGWRVRLVHTGRERSNGSRLLRLKPWLDRDSFLMAWSDGLSDIDLRALAACHRAERRLVTLAAVHPPSRFGMLHLEGSRITSFEEKPRLHQLWINGAFFAADPAIFDQLTPEGCSLESDVLPRLTAEDELTAYRHEGFWDCMDTPADQERLECLWNEGSAPWARWRQAA